MKSSNCDAIILCGGKGLRTGSKKNKVICYFGVKTALEYCLDNFEPFCRKLIVVSAPNDYDEISALAAPYGAEVVLGGETRSSSVRKGLEAVTADTVIIHDGARPFVSGKTIENCIDSANKFGSGIAAIKVTDTVKRVEDGIIKCEVDRNDLYCVQTPQVYKTYEIKAAYNLPIEATDDSAFYAAAGFTPHIVESSPDNKKITVPDDLISPPPCNKIGTGVDFHTFRADRKLIIGGTEIPYKMGLEGNSDADVLTHAVMDALLSAIGAPDIGVLFPCTDEFKDADSMELLKKVVSMVKASESKIISVSAVIMAQAPKMKEHIPHMRKALAAAMETDERKINISATTTEGMGIIGRGDGIAASAVCLLQ